MVSSSLRSLLAWAALASAGKLVPRQVASLNQAATAEAHKRDDGATRAFSNVQIKTSDGKCLFVDKLSGDFRANLTPIKVGTCGSTDGEGFDVITAGKHVAGNGVAIIVSTLTQACFNHDDRKAAGKKVNLFSCGGRADGTGDKTDSQVFTFDGSAGPLALQPKNGAGQCFTVKGDVVDIDACNGGATQQFTFGGATAGGAAGGNGGGNGGNNGGAATPSATPAGGNGGGAAGGNAGGAATTAAPAGNNNGGAAATPSGSSTACTTGTRTVTVPAPGDASAAPSAAPVPVDGANNGAVNGTDGNGAGNGAGAGSGAGAGNGAGAETSAGAGAGAGNGNIPPVNPTDPVPVSKAGGKLNPTSAAQAQQRDATAERAFTAVEIRAPNGQCLFVDPTAGDFRQNLIPIATKDCTGSPNEKWDIITKGKHNEPDDRRGPAALVVSTLTNGCISTDDRKDELNNVHLFSCGGRADGEGSTNTGQLFPFIGQTSFALASVFLANKTCVEVGSGATAGILTLGKGACPTDGSQLFSIFP